MRPQPGGLVRRRPDEIPALGQSLAEAWRIKPACLPLPLVQNQLPLNLSRHAQIQEGLESDRRMSPQDRGRSPQKTSDQAFHPTFALPVACTLSQRRLLSFKLRHYLLLSSLVRDAFERAPFLEQRLATPRVSLV